MAITKIPKELKLNKYEYSQPIHPRDLVGRTGYASMPASSYTGDNLAEMPTDKIHELQRGALLVEEEIKSKTE